LDAMLIACDKPKAEFMKGNSAKNPARAEVKAIFDGLVEKKFIAQASANNYNTSFWIAFETGVPFQRDLVNQKSEAKKAETTKSANQKAGPVISTTREALDKTLSKALAQARALNLDIFAGEMLDLCLESLDGFKETVLDK
jgi:hypothetical protein